MTPALAAATWSSPLAALVWVLWFRIVRSDRTYRYLPAGEVPSFGGHTPTRRVGRREKVSVVPAGRAPDMTPALAQAVTDGSIHPHSLAATIVGLTVAGPVHVLPSEDGNRHTVELSRTPPSADRAELSEADARLLDDLFDGQDSIALDRLASRSVETYRRWEIAVYTEILRRRWYTRHPRSRNSLGSAIGGLLVLFGILGVLVTVALSGDGENAMVVHALLGAVLAGLILAVGGSDRSLRTPAGTAARLRALGLQADLALGRPLHGAAVERDLAYAMALGVLQPWAAAVDERWPDAARTPALDRLDPRPSDAPPRTWADVVVAVETIQHQTEAVLLSGLALLRLEPVDVHAAPPQGCSEYTAAETFFLGAYGLVSLVSTPGCR